MDKSRTFESDQALLEALRRGDTDAFEFLYHQYYRMVAQQANRYRWEEAKIEDLFQDVLLALVQKVRVADFELTAKLSTFLFAITRNLILKKSSKPDDIPLDEATMPSYTQPEQEEDAGIREAQLNAVADALNTLEPDCRTMLLLSFYEKRSQTEIAEIMGYTEAFVKVKKHRCLNYLRKHIRDHPLFRDD